MQFEDEGEGESWAGILARRGPAGRAVVDELNRAEQAVLVIQDRITAAILERRDYAEDFTAMAVAMTELDRLRSEVYRLARQ
jgi:hypothetical protein